MWWSETKQITVQIVIQIQRSGSHLSSFLTKFFIGTREVFSQGLELSRVVTLGASHPLQ